MTDDVTSPRILFITEAFGSGLFGVSEVLLQLTSYCAEQKIPYQVMAARVGSISEDQRKLTTTLPIYLFSLKQTILSRALRWHPKMESCIRERVKAFRPNILHVHGALTAIQRTAVSVAASEGIPVVLSPHGMLEPWMWTQKGRLYYVAKRIYWKTLIKPVLKKVNYFHSITRLEKEALKQEFPGIPQITIPNGLRNAEIQQYSVPARPENFFLFVGRLHPTKGVDVLIRAFDRAHLDAKWRLLIVGPDYDPSYGRSLRNLARSLDMEDRVVFKGAIFGGEKNLLFSTAWATIVPSFSEVVSLVNLESAAAFAPTITTYSTGLDDWGESGGILVSPNVDQLAGALSRAASWSIEERMKRGRLAHRFVQERYSWEVIGKEWLDSYRQISRGG